MVEEIRVLPPLIKVVRLNPINKLNELIAIVFKFAFDNLFELGVFLCAAEHILSEKEKLALKALCQEYSVEYFTEDNNRHLIQQVMFCREFVKE